MALELDVRGNTGQFQSSMRGGVAASAAFGGAIGTLVAQALPALQRTLGQVVGRTGELAAVETGFTNMARSAGLAGDAMLRDLRPATRGMISDFELMKLTNNAMSLGIVRSESEFTELAGAASTLGRSLGIDVNQAMSSLVTGLGRQSKLVLDNLGIIVDTDKAYRDYADALNKTVKELDDAERKTAFLNAAMIAITETAEKAGEAAFTLGDLWAVAGAKADNAISDIARGVNSSAAMNQRLAEMNSQLNETSNEGLNNFQIFGAAAANMLAGDGGIGPMSFLQAINDVRNAAFEQDKTLLGIYPTYQEIPDVLRPATMAFEDQAEVIADLSVSLPTVVPLYEQMIGQALRFRAVDPRGAIGNLPFGPGGQLLSGAPGAVDISQLMWPGMSPPATTGHTGLGGFMSNIFSPGTGSFTGFSAGTVPGSPGFFGSMFGGLKSSLGFGPEGFSLGNIFSGNSGGLGSILGGLVGGGGAGSSGFSGILSSVLGGMLGPLGGIASSLIGKLGGLFGPSQQEKEGRDAASSFRGDRSHGDLLSQITEGLRATGMDAGKAADEARRLGDALFDAEKRGAPAVQAVAGEIQGILDNAEGAKESVMEMADAIAEAVGRGADATNRFADSFGGAIDELGGDLLGLQFNTFAAEMQAGGAGILDILEQFAPTLDAANESGVELGGQFAFLQGLSQKLAGNEGLGMLIERQGALNDMLRANADLHLLNQDNFNLFQENAVKGFDELAKELGSGNMALRVQGPLLASIRDIADEYGFEIDEATQALIDQGEEIGALPEPVETVEGILGDMRDVLIGIADVFGAELPDSVRRFRDRVADDMGKVGDDIDRAIDTDKIRDKLERGLGEIRFSPEIDDRFLDNLGRGVRREFDDALDGIAN